MSPVQVTENTFRSSRNSTFYLASGPSQGTPIIFVHGVGLDVRYWPEADLALKAQ